MPGGFSPNRGQRLISPAPPYFDETGAVERKPAAYVRAP